MSINEGVRNAVDLEALTRLMELSCKVSDHAQALYGTEEIGRGMELMETADLIAEEVGVWLLRTGYTIEEVTAPLWGEPHAECSMPPAA